MSQNRGDANIMIPTKRIAFFGKSRVERNYGKPLYAWDHHAAASFPSIRPLSIYSSANSNSCEHRYKRGPYTFSGSSAYSLSTSSSYIPLLYQQQRCFSAPKFSTLLSLSSASPARHLLHPSSESMNWRSGRPMF